MKVTIDGKEHEVLDPDKLTNQEIMAIEKETGEPFTQWEQMSMGVMTGLVWASLRRETPELRYKDVSFTMADITDQDEEEQKAEAEEAGKGKKRAS